MEDKTKITEEQVDSINGGSVGFAIPDDKVSCPNCNADDIIFDKSEYIPHKGQWTYHYWCRTCGNRFQKVKIV